MDSTSAESKTTTYFVLLQWPQDISRYILPHLLTRPHACYSPLCLRVCVFTLLTAGPRPYPSPVASDASWPKPSVRPKAQTFVNDEVRPGRVGGTRRATKTVLWLNTNFFLFWKRPIGPNLRKLFEVFFFGMSLALLQQKRSCYVLLVFLRYSPLARGF